MADLLTDILNQYPVLKENFTERAVKRYASQYAESAKVKAEMGAFMAEVEKLRDAVIELLTLRWIDTAEGFNLDVIGELVGQPRIAVDPPFYFGYLANPEAEGYGNGRYKQKFESQIGKRVVADPEYRLFIKSKAFGNLSNTSAESLAKHIFFVLGKKTRINNERAEVRIYFTELLNRNEIALLDFQWLDSRGQLRDFFSYTLGIQRKIYYHSASSKLFGYLADATAFGYGVGAYAARIA